LGFHQDGKVLVRWKDGVGLSTAAHWDSDKPAVVSIEGYDKDLVFGVAFSPDGRRVAVSGGFDKPFTFHDAATGKKLRSFDPPGRPTSVLLFSRDGKTLVASHGDQTISVWDVA